MSDWRQWIDHALDNETRQSEDEQLAWIAREPSNARPYYHLAQLRRMQYKPQEGLALLLEAVRLDPQFGEAHAALTEMYAVTGDSRAAWRHARLAAQSGVPRAVELLQRYGVPE